MKRPHKFDQTQTELTSALHTLRLVVREVGQNYIAGLQADVAQLELAIRQARVDDVPDRKQLAQMASMLKRITALEIKPQKGRRRDLKELDKLITKLSDLTDNW